MNGDDTWQLRQLMQIHELFLIGDLLLERYSASLFYSPQNCICSFQPMSKILRLMVALLECDSFWLLSGPKENRVTGSPNGPTVVIGVNSFGFPLDRHHSLSQDIHRISQAISVWKAGWKKPKRHQLIEQMVVSNMSKYLLYLVLW